MTPDQYRREGAEAMREAAARITEGSYRCRSCGKVFLNDNGHSDVDCSQGYANWDTATDAQKAIAIRALDVDVVLAAASAWKGPGETPHRYSPDYMSQGDCRVCGHTREAHQPAPDAVTRLVEAAMYLLSEYDAPNPVDDAVSKLRAALAAMDTSHD